MKCGEFHVISGSFDFPKAFPKSMQFWGHHFRDNSASLFIPKKENMFQFRLSKILEGGSILSHDENE